MADLPVAIIGSGLAGMTLALALSQKGFAVTLVGPDIGQEKDMRTTAIMRNGIDMLDQLGAWEGCASNATPLKTMELVDKGSTHIFQATEIGLAQFGFNIDNAALKRSLAGTIRISPRIDWQKTTMTGAVKTDAGWKVLTGSKKPFTAALLVGADGAKSMVRDLAGIATDIKDDDQMAMVAVLQAEQAHDFTSVEWYRAGGPFTLVPMADKKLAMVWCDTQNVLTEKFSCAAAQRDGDITEITQSRFGALRMITTPSLWPVRPTKARRMTGAHVALVGEAAHALPPIGAQGFNTSLNDVHALAQALAKGKELGLAANDPSILSSFEKKRLPDIALRYHGVNLLNDMIRARSPGVAMLRRISLQTLGVLPPLKNGLMRFGMGIRK